MCGGEKLITRKIILAGQTRHQQLGREGNVVRWGGTWSDSEQLKGDRLVKLLLSLGAYLSAVRCGLKVFLLLAQAARALQKECYGRTPLEA